MQVGGGVGDPERVGAATISRYRQTMPMTHTYTKTYALMDAWAISLPWARCGQPCNHATPHVGDPCAVEDCGKPLLAGETIYKVTQMPDDAYVCWRHVRPDDGPVRVRD